MSINIIRYEDLGHHDYGWLNARYHFSFGKYYDPTRMGFGPLRVINDDIVRAGAGFPPHPHEDMEIITYVRSGAITHKDSLGNTGRTAAGDVQVMSAGAGIQHGEANAESIDTTLYQIWIEPRKKGIAPRWAAAQFPKTPVSGQLQLLVSGHAADQSKNVLNIEADAAIYGGRLAGGVTIHHSLGSANAYLLVADGALRMNDQELKKGDGAEITATKELTLQAETESEILLIVLPA